ncbi:hypothetical protein VTO42DRAFT_7336 [Malbranchea cinnamomea]
MQFLAKMENPDSVDVSWLHHSQKDHLVRTRSTSSVTSITSDSASAAVEAPKPQTTTKSSEKSTPQATFSSTPQPLLTAEKHNSKKGKGTIETPPKQLTLNTPTASSPNTSKPISAKSSNTSRRNSWISSLSSKFSSGSTPPSPSPLKDHASNTKQSPQGSRPEFMNPFGAAVSPRDLDKKDEQTHPPSPQSHKSSHPSFFHNALRRLSPSGGGLGKNATQGTVCPRRVMNIDHNRDRCRVPELDPAKLRRVAFCVDVEIAGTSRRSDSEDDSGPTTNGRKHSSSRDETDEGSAGMQTQSATSEASSDATAKASSPAEGGHNEEQSQAKEPTRKQEKKKKSEEERKERKERRRRQAEENGTIPMQLDGSSAPMSKSRSRRGQDQPTTDPVRIYRRCCQLRETGVLRKLVEQISSPSSVLAESPGTVAVLDLTGFWMTLPDIITFADWLAIVPVRKLILQNCGLTDEAVRVILGGLLATKTIEAARYSRGLSKNKETPIPREERYGAIEKLSLKDNPKIGPEGWRHIGLFIHMSRSLKGIDLSGIPFPRLPTPVNSPSSSNKTSKPSADIRSIFSKALAERFAGNRLEELVISECYPSTEDLEKICDAVIKVGLRRFGVANNNLTKDGLEHVLRYFRAGHCEGLDLGGNNIDEHLGLVASAIEKSQTLSALSLADCSLTPPSLCGLLKSLTTLPTFKFIDLSHNPALFSSQPDSLAMLRRYLPQLPELRRIHLVDVSLSPEHAIALAEILPDCPKLCHINVLENPKIQALASATDAEMQEEACALYASFTAAVRVSRTLIAIDIDVPTADNNEVVKALASQIVAYSLHNLERGELVDELPSSTDVAADKHSVPVPEILAHIVGRSDSPDEPIKDDELAPDEDYVISGTGVVKALGICLGNAHTSVEGVDLQSPPPSGATTPVRRLSQPPLTKKPRDMSKNLLESARKIRVRLQPALVREDRAGNDVNYRRLQFLDSTLQRMIQRFEDVFPETRISAEKAPVATSIHSSNGDETELAKSVPNESSHLTAAALSQLEAETAIDDDDEDQFAVRLSRRSSNTSLHSRQLTSEEGQVHRLGQHLRRDILDSELSNPKGDVSQSPSGGIDVAALREKLEKLRESQSQSQIETDGAGQAIQEVGSSLEELLTLQKQDPEAFADFKESQIAALINAGLREKTG